jgi:molybdopterin converting factor small subunit
VLILERAGSRFAGLKGTYLPGRVNEYVRRKNMSVKLNIDSQFFGRDKDASRDVRIEVSGRTVGECLGQYLLTKPDIIRDFFDKSGQLEKTTYLYINKRPVFADKLERELKDGDELMFLYAPQWRC